jgi:hypothetical protein
LKTVFVARAGNLPVADLLAQMQAWLAESNIVPRELVMLHVLNLRVVFRATFDADSDADLFDQTFGYHPAPPDAGFGNATVDPKLHR